jgi:hypothetical protein
MGSQLGLGGVLSRSQPSLCGVPAGSRLSPNGVPAGFGVVLATVREFENEKFKLEKWFIVLKNENYFTEIKEDFSVKSKMFSVDYYFSSYQKQKITENIFQK